MEWPEGLGVLQDLEDGEAHAYYHTHVRLTDVRDPAPVSSDSLSLSHWPLHWGILAPSPTRGTYSG